MATNLSQASSTTALCRLVSSNHGGDHSFLHHPSRGRHNIRYFPHNPIEWQFAFGARGTTNLPAKYTLVFIVKGSYTSCFYCPLLLQVLNGLAGLGDHIDLYSLDVTDLANKWPSSSANEQI